MVFDDPVKIDQIPVDIVQDFDFDRLLQKEERCCTAEGFHVTGMIREKRNDVPGQFTFSADPRDNGFCLIAHCHYLSLSTLAACWQEAQWPSDKID